MQLCEEGQVGEAYHIVDGSTFRLTKQYPCVAAPGYECIISDRRQEPAVLAQFFNPRTPIKSTPFPASNMVEVQIMGLVTLKHVGSQRVQIRLCHGLGLPGWGQPRLC